MKPILLFICYLITITSFGQKEDIYRLIFSDKSNFELTTLLEHKMPVIFFVIDTTAKWNPNKFWLTDLDDQDKEKVMKQIQNDEHHPYFNSYFFSDTALNRLFSDNTKKQLSVKSKEITSKPIVFHGSNYKTISSSKSIRGYYFVTSEPIFSDNKRFAFIDMTVYYKENYKQPIDETYFGTIAIVFQRQIDNSWKRIAKKDCLIL